MVWLGTLACRDEQPRPAAKNVVQDSTRTKRTRSLGKPREPFASEVLDWLYSGKTLTSYCAQKGKPKARTISDWCRSDDVYAAEFARARVAMASLELDRASDIADKATPRNVLVARLQVETCLKRAACFAPHLYGDKAVRHLHDHSVRIQLDTGIQPSRLDAPVQRLTITADTHPDPDTHPDQLEHDQGG